MTWTQPVCAQCWEREHPGITASAIVPEHRDEEVCCLCGQETRDGIYERLDPALVPYPAGQVRLHAEPGDE